MANGLIERFHRQLKSAMKASNQPNNWTDILPFALLGIRTVPKTDINASVAEMVFGTTLTLPGELISCTKDNSVPDPSNFVGNSNNEWQSFSQYSRDRQVKHFIWTKILTIAVMFGLELILLGNPYKHLIKDLSKC